MKKTANFILFILGSLFLFSAIVYGQNLNFSFSPRLWGIDFFLFINDFPSKLGDFATLQMILGIGAGWESYGFFRDSSNNPVSYTENPPYQYYFNRLDIIGTFGLAFLFAYNESYGKYLSQIRLKFITNYQTYEQQSNNDPTYLSQTNFPDKEGIFQNNIKIEYLFDMTRYSTKFHTYNGFDLLLSFEIFPKFINQIADFTRFQGILRGYLTLIESENLSLYIADRVQFYYISAISYIPVSALTMGSLGYVMRGVYWCQYEGKIRLNNNFDIRLFFLNLFNQSFIIPGLIIFFDIGTNDYQNLDNKLDFNLIQYSTGVGLVLVIFGIDLIDFYLDYNIKEARLSYALRFALYF